MRYLLDTDHITILQRMSGAEYAALSARMASESPDEFALCVVSFHEQTRGAHTYINQARTNQKVVQGYERFNLLLSFYASFTVLRFDAPAVTEFDALWCRAGIA